MASTPEHRRVEQAAQIAGLGVRLEQTRRIVRWLLVGAVVICALWPTWVFLQSYQGRKEVVASQRLGCVRGVLDRADAIGGDEDEADFRHDAAVTRAGSAVELVRLMRGVAHGVKPGTRDGRAAVEYERSAMRATKRAVSRRGRLLGASYDLVRLRDRNGRSTEEARAEAARVCVQAYPSASPWPWVARKPTVA